jgi:hypothetical protein
VARHTILDEAPTSKVGVTIEWFCGMNVKLDGTIETWSVKPKEPALAETSAE